MFRVTLILLCFVAIVSCRETALPKQHGFPQVEFPKHEYQNWQIDEVPFTFQKPVYSQMVADASGKYWYNLTYTPFNATLHLSYHDFKDLSKLDTLIFDTRNLVYKHTIKASDIIEEEILDSNGRGGMYYFLEGETATACNFYLTDSKSKFFRGALYFNSYTTIDSVAPVVSFIKKDINQMIKSFKFQ